MNKLALKDAVIGYGRRVILDKVNLSMVGGESAVLLGPNGSGKTSLIRCLLDLQKLQGGVREMTFERVGYVPQIRHLDRQFPFTVEKCLELSFPGFEYFWSPTRKKEMREKVQQVMEYTGIAHFSKQLIRECSGGQLQRTLIARALVNNPDFLVLDEPTNSLDRAGKDQVFALLRKLQNEKNMTLLLTTHEGNLSLTDMFHSRIDIENGVVLRSELS